LVAFEVAAAVVLLAGAGLLVRTYWNITEVRPGLNADGVVTGRIDLPPSVYAAPYQQSQFVVQLLERLHGRPEVRSAAVSTGLPFSTVGDSGIRFEGRVEGELSGTAANHYRISPQYQQVMQIPLVRGGLFNEGDVAERRPVVLINETLARRFFPDEDPIGKRLDISGPTYMREIVGVVGDVKQDGLRRPTPPQVYEPFYQKPATGFTVVIRGSDPARLADVLRSELRAVDRDQPVSHVEPMTAIVGRTLSTDRMSAGLLSLFGAMALGLAAIGIFGLLAYSVARRTREIGVRMALGAPRSGIVQMIVGEGMMVVGLGIAIGLAGSLALSRVLRTLLYEVEPYDPVTLISAALVLLAVAALAAFIPAQRAACVDPLVALRTE
jgi:predicted permease